MKHKSKELFSHSQIVKRKTPGQQEFEEEFKKVLIDAKYCMDSALEMMHSERALHPPSYRNKNWASVTINGFLTGLLSKKYPSQMKPDYGVVRYVSNKALLYFKKLDENYYPNNVRTEKVGLERNQYSLFGDLNIPIIYVGYIPDKTFDTITGYHAVCIDKWDNIVWISDLTELENYETTSSTSASFEPDVDIKDKLVLVKKGKYKQAK
jgi:hypothetical protein